MRGFPMYSATHWAALGTIAFLIILLIVFRGKIQKSPGIKKIIRICAPLFVGLSLLFNYFWSVSSGMFDIQSGLPLHLCDITFVFVIFFFIFENNYLFEFMYFIGISGAIQALLTPALGYDFPHVMYIFFFSEHGIVTLTGLYGVLIGKYRPVPFSIVRSMIFLNGMGIFVFIVDLILGSDYMFLLRKPSTSSLFDLLGPWPIYLVVCELIALACFVLLYLPFMF
jgi:hypothetical integral membrane protein (TIGR02206 family)